MMTISKKFTKQGAFVMGLIREVQNVGASLNKQERARRERERLKILQENYKKELQEFLFAEFIAIFKQYDMETAEEITILKKDDIIKKLHDEIYNRHYKEEGGAVKLVFLPAPPWDKKWKFERESIKKYLYRDFDIITDLYSNYDTILKKVKKQSAEELKLKHKRILTRLENALKLILNNMEDKYFAFINLKKYDNINCIIDILTEKEEEKELLLSHYNNILSKIEKLYYGDIQKRKMEIKQEEEEKKNRHKKKVAGLLLWGYVLTSIKKALPPAFSKKRKY